MRAPFPFSATMHLHQQGGTIRGNSVFKSVMVVLSFVLGAVSCHKDCAEQTGTLPDIDLTHLRPAGTYSDPHVTEKSETMEYINDSTVVISFTADNKTVRMTYRVKHQGTYESVQSKFN